MNNVSISFAENAGAGHAAMMCGAAECSKLAIWAENVKEIHFHNVKLEGLSLIHIFIIVLRVWQFGSAMVLFLAALKGDVYKRQVWKEEQPSMAAASSRSRGTLRMNCTS